MSNPTFFVIAQEIDSVLHVWSGFDEGFVYIAPESVAPVVFPAASLSAARRIIGFVGGDIYEAKVNATVEAVCLLSQFQLLEFSRH